MKHSHTLYVSLAVFLATGGVAIAEESGSQTLQANKIIGNGSPAVATEALAKAPDGSVLEAGKIIGNGSPIPTSETANRVDGKIIGNGLTAASGQ